MNDQNGNTQKADALIAELNALHPLPNVPQDDWIDLDRLDDIVQELRTTKQPERATRALFGVWERFPNYEDNGVFWSVLHALERLPGYETELVASVRRVPCEFNLLMVNRILNVDQTHVGDTDLFDLLQETADRADASDDARKKARGFIEHQASRKENT